MSRRDSGLCCWPVASIVIALVLGLSSPALADESATAGKAAVTLSERRAADAFQAYSKGDYAGAVALYLDAYDADPSGSILYNVARIYDLKLADRSQAMSFYRRYVADAGAQADLIQVANQRLRELNEAQLASANPSDERLRIAGDTRQGTDGSSRGARDPAQGTRPGWSPARWLGVAVGAGGLVAIGVGAGFGLAAMAKASTADDLCDGNACSSQRGVDAAHLARTDAAISNVAFASGGALLATGVAVFLLTRNKERDQKSRADVHVGIDLGNWATTSGASLRLSGKW